MISPTDTRMARCQSSISLIMFLSIFFCCTIATWGQGLVVPFAAEHPVSNSKKWAVIIGIDEYKYKPLKNCSNDAHSVAQMLRKEYGYSSDHILILTDRSRLKDKYFTDIGTVVGEANCKNIQSLFTNRRILGKSIEKQDSVFFFYAGHGGKGGQIYPTDALSTSIDGPKLVSREIVSSRTLIQQMAVLPAHNIFAVFDCCFGGTILDLAGHLPHKNGSTQVMTAGTAQEEVADSGTKVYNLVANPTAENQGAEDHSLFTGYLLRILGSGGLRSDGIWRTGDITNILRARVSADARSHQTPDGQYLQGSGTGEDFCFYQASPARQIPWTLTDALEFDASGDLRATAAQAMYEWVEKQPLRYRFSLAEKASALIGLTTIRELERSDNLPGTQIGGELEDKPLLTLDAWHLSLREMQDAPIRLPTYFRMMEGLAEWNTPTAVRWLAFAGTNPKGAAVLSVLQITHPAARRAIRQAVGIPTIRLPLANIVLMIEPRKRDYKWFNSDTDYFFTLPNNLPGLKERLKCAFRSTSDSEQLLALKWLLWLSDISTIQNAKSVAVGNRGTSTKGSALYGRRAVELLAESIQNNTLVPDRDAYYSQRPQPSSDFVQVARKALREILASSQDQSIRQSALIGLAKSGSVDALVKWSSLQPVAYNDVVFPSTVLLEQTDIAPWGEQVPILANLFDCTNWQIAAIARNWLLGSGDQDARNRLGTSWKERQVLDPLHEKWKYWRSDADFPVVVALAKAGDNQALAYLLQQDEQISANIDHVPNNEKRTLRSRLTVLLSTIAPLLSVSDPSYARIRREMVECIEASVRDGYFLDDHFLRSLHSVKLTQALPALTGAATAPPRGNSPAMWQAQDRELSTYERRYYTELIYAIAHVDYREVNEMNEADRFVTERYVIRDRAAFVAAAASGDQTEPPLTGKSPSSTLDNFYGVEQLPVPAQGTDYKDIEPNSAITGYLALLDECGLYGRAKAIYLKSSSPFSRNMTAELYIRLGDWENAFPILFEQFRSSKGDGYPVPTLLAVLFALPPTPALSAMKHDVSVALASDVNRAAAFLRASEVCAAYGKLAEATLLREKARSLVKVDESDVLYVLESIARAAILRASGREDEADDALWIVWHRGDTRGFVSLNGKAPWYPFEQYGFGPAPTDVAARNMVHWKEALSRGGFHQSKMLYLARLLERQQDYENAIAVYKNYTAVYGTTSEIAKTIRKLETLTADPSDH